LAPLSARCLLVGADQGGIEHQILVVGIAGERGEDLLPDAGLGPAREALVDGLVLAVSLRNVLPTRAGPQNPQNTVHKPTVIAACPAGITGLARQKIRNPIPLRIRKFVPLGHRWNSRSKNLESYESHIQARGNPECRLDLVHPLMCSFMQKRLSSCIDGVTLVGNIRGRAPFADGPSPFRTTHGTSCSCSGARW